MRRMLILLLFAGATGCSHESRGSKIVEPAANEEQPPDEVLLCPATWDTIKVPTSVPPRPQQLDWQSPTPGGLEIAAWLDHSGRFIWCVIRNPNRTPLEYNDYFLGYFECVKLLARSESDAEWKALKRRDLAIYQYVKAAGSTTSNIHVLQPGEEVPPPSCFRIMDTSSDSRYSFFVPLEHFEWPNEWSGNVEVMIRQYGVQMTDESAFEEPPPLRTASMPVNLDVLEGSVP